MVVWLVVLYLIVYFMMILPNKKQKKKHENMMNELKVNDTVVTIGGIKATVANILEDFVELKVDTKGNRITVKKSAISKVMNKD